MLLSAVSASLQELLAVNDSTDLYVFANGTPRDQVQEGVSEFVLEKIQRWWRKEPSSDPERLPPETVQRLSQKLYHCRIALTSIMSTSSKEAKSLVENGQLAIVAAKLPPDPRLCVEVHKAIEDLEKLVSTNPFRRTFGSIFTYPPTLLPRIFWQELSLKKKLQCQRIEKLNRLVTPYWQKHLLTLWEKDSEVVDRQTLSRYLSPTQAGYLAEQFLDQGQEGNFVYLLFCTPWNTGKQVLLGLEPASLNALLNGLQKNSRMDKDWRQQCGSTLSLETKQSTHALLEAYTVFTQRLQETAICRVAQNDLLDGHQLSETLRLEISALERFVPYLEKLSIDEECALALRKCKEELMDVVQALGTFIKKIQHAREENAFKEEAEELSEVLPRWGIWAYTECLETGLLLDIPQEELPSIQGQHFIHAAKYLARMGITNGEDLRDRNIFNREDLKRFLASQVEAESE